MKTILVFHLLVSVFLIFSVPLSAQEDSSKNRDSGYAFSLTPAFGFLWGRGEELVFQEDPPLNNSPYTSQLLWDFKPLLYLGIDAEFGPRRLWEKSGFHGALSLKYGLPTETGIMADRDWLSGEGDYLTNYSQHDASSRSAPGDLFSGYGTFTANLSGGFSWSFAGKYWLRAYGELSYLRFSWMASGGYTQYGPNDPGGTVFVPWNSGFPKYPYSGKAVAYTQNWVLFAPGLGAGMRVSKRLTLSLYFLCTPLLYGECMDEHFSRSTVFVDYFYGGLYIRGGGGAGFTLGENLTINLSAALTKLSKTRGDEYISVDGGSYSFLPDSVGGGFSFLDISLSVKYSF